MEDKQISVNVNPSGRNISWELFKVHNGKGASEYFEAMCRKLFNYRFFDGEGLLVSSPNNVGVEIEPIFCEKIQKTISFQAKFFEQKTDYTQIRHSMEETINAYSDSLEVVYLYCNHDMSIRRKSYRDIEQMLASHNIKIYPITDETLLSEIQKYPELIDEYFGSEITKKILDNTGRILKMLEAMKRKTAIICSMVAIIICILSGIFYYMKTAHHDYKPTLQEASYTYPEDGITTDILPVS